MAQVSVNSIKQHWLTSEPSVCIDVFGHCILIPIWQKINKKRKIEKIRFGVISLLYLCTKKDAQIPVSVIVTSVPTSVSSYVSLHLKGFPSHQY